MITLPPYIKDYQAWDLMPEKDRWIFNKLEICTRFGYQGGPCGTPMPQGTHCIRPLINLSGMGSGGFWKVRTRQGQRIDKSGYVWTPWETGKRQWVEYVNDEVSSALKQVSWSEQSQLERYVEIPADKAQPLPYQLMGISRYMLVEFLGDTVIDIGPRHLSEDAKQSVIADYRKFDPTFDWETSNEFAPCMKRVVLENGGYGWEELEVFVPRKIYR